MVSGGSNTDVTIWLPSNFSGYITVSGSHASFSPSFVELVMPNAHLNRGVPKAWSGDEITIETGGRVAFRVWDVLSRRAEPENAKIGKVGKAGKTTKSGPTLGRKRAQGPGDVWRRMFGGGASEGKGLRSQDAQTWDWDFLIEDQTRFFSLSIFRSPLRIIRITAGRLLFDHLTTFYFRISIISSLLLLKIPSFFIYMYPRFLTRSTVSIASYYICLMLTTNISTNTYNNNVYEL